MSNHGHTPSRHQPVRTVIHMDGERRLELVDGVVTRSENLRFDSQQANSSQVGAVGNRTGAIPKRTVNNSSSVQHPVVSIGNKPVIRRNPPRRARPDYVSSCGRCQGTDTSRMVQCDSCDYWFHLECVESSESVAEVSWQCPNCTPRGREHSDQRNKRDDTAKSTSAKSTRSESKRRVELLLQKLEEKKAFVQQYLDEKYSLLESLNDAGGSNSGSEKDFLSGSNNISKIEEWLGDTDRCGIEDSGLAVEEMSDGPSPDEPIRINKRVLEPAAQSLHPRARQLPRETGNQPQPRPSHRSTGPRSSGEPNPGSGPPPRSSQGHPHGPPGRQSIPCNGSQQGDDREADDHPFVPGQRSTPAPHHPQPLRQGDQIDETAHILNRSQIAARQAVSKELPEFNGDPEDWPLFFSMFNSSTSMCGFTNEENMLRLRKCLKGKALDAVKSRLLHPSNVAGVLSTLQMLYGRPEMIIQAIIRKIRALPPPTIEKLDTLVGFALAVENLVATVQACEVKDFIYNASLKYELVERLPPALKLDWAKYTRNNPFPNLLHFSEWLRSMAEDATAVSTSLASEYRPRGGKKDSFLNVHAECADSFHPQGSQTNQRVSSTPIKECIVCKGNCPSIAKCKRFSDFNCESRWAIVKERKMCRKCLRKHNGSCRQKNACGINGCSYFHHPLLHSESQQKRNEAVAQSERSAIPDARNTGSSCNIHQGQSDVLFRIAPITLYGPAKTVHTYAFIDDGSELTLIEQSLADELGVEGPQQSLCLRWTGGARRTETSKIVDLKIAGSSNPNKKYNLYGVHTIGDLQLRPQTLIVPEIEKKYPHLSGLPLQSYQDVSPRLLIGLDHATLGNAMKSREGNPFEPIAIKTRLGWVVYGNCTSRHNADHYVNYHSLQVCRCNVSGEADLHQMMKQYFSIDSLGISQPEKMLLSKDEERAQNLLVTLTRPINGRFESGLLWRYDNARLPESRLMALKRWDCLERRMRKDHQFAEMLRQKMADYVAKGYVRKLTAEELQQPHNRVWYLPVFPVMNPNKPNKIRLVWDAAAASHGVSLNDLLLKGPDQLASLLSILIQFREFRVAVCGDIREMYLQVLVMAGDQHCLRFFWKDQDTDEEVSVYILLVMPFGASCSPSIAQYVKNSNAKRFEQDHPIAVHAIVHKHYVDDMLVSVETEEEAIALATDVKKIHEAGGFEMRNWISNSSKVVAALHETDTSEKDLSIGSEMATEKVLGMWWDTVGDCFTYKLSSRYDVSLLSGKRRPTKREVLRILMMMFDPMGLISHFLMHLKVLLQEIWRSSIGWDDEILEPQYMKWLEWLEVLPKVTTLRIPRCYRMSTSVGEDNEVQLHIFVDASENGFATAIYLRFCEGSTVECALVGAKTRVAPLRFLSIPRSELQAAVIGTRLANTVMQSLSMKITRRVFWTDSKDVLWWLNSDHRRYSQFVAVRVSEILEATNADEWQYIPSKLNVADDGTKWKRKPELSASSRWFHGPEFLWDTEANWPSSSPPARKIDEELRPHLLLHFVQVNPVIEIQNFSRWKSLLSRMAYVFRAADNFRYGVSKQPFSRGPLTQDELLKAENYLYHVAQNSKFSDEIAILTSTNAPDKPKRQIPKGSPLFHLCPYLDDNGLLRVRGRTKACEFIDSNTANPLILPRDHYLTKLVVASIHEEFKHQNHETTMNEIRQRYYISRLKSVYRSMRNDCQRCIIDRASPRPPLMSDLPAARLAAFSRPFTHMGVDYFGPIMVLVGRRAEKRWGVLATCLTTRAIHLEVACSLTTDSCILAIRNIMARRGTPSVIYSDRGTNFQGASKELKEAIKNLDEEKLMAEFTTPRTQWRFITPASPHMGGAWERLVRTVKQNLTKLKTTRLPTDEILRNLFAEVENIVNSRPLTAIPLDDDESPVLTPNHFLIGSSNGLRSWVPFNDNPSVLKQNWRLSQELANTFWRMWLRDYLPELTRRTKWLVETRPLKVDDIVVIVDPNLPRNCWPKGRIISTKVAPDGQVRQATIQTGTGIYERPAVKLALIDVRAEGNTP